MPLWSRFVGRVSFQDLSFALDVDHAQEPFHLIDEIILLAAQVAFKQDDVTSVQLQVIKLFLTIVTAEALQVHSISLLNILKVCFLIHSASSLKSTNELTSKVGCLLLTPGLFDADD